MIPAMLWLSQQRMSTDSVNVTQWQPATCSSFFCQALSHPLVVNFIIEIHGPSAFAFPHSSLVFKGIVHKGSPFVEAPAAQRKLIFWHSCGSHCFRKCPATDCLLFCSGKKSKPGLFPNQVRLQIDFGVPVTTCKVLCLPAAGSPQESCDIFNLDLHFAFAGTLERFLKTTFLGLLEALGLTRIRKSFCS